MKPLYAVFLALLLGASSAVAAPASENSIKQLLAVTKSRELVDSMQGQFGAIMNLAIEKALEGKTPTPAQQRAIDNMKSKLVTLMKGELAWEKMEPLYQRLYRESFSEEEVAGMLKFYRTPAGKAVIQKMPVLMQRTMQEMQQTVNEFLPKMQKIQQEFAAEFVAASREPAPAAPPPAAQ